jgi:Nucleoside-diphosphate-sugar pyrophosphorylase involved in lipopolysaccharide biosynthesis/translation initiation factor 2B, gamma/epsilon subunits (eIF-2Bgamma/eIF-2Bepsilon)
MNGDEYKEVDLERLYAAHNRFQAKATIALTTMAQPEGFGVAVLDGNHILRFEEKPGASTSHLINAGLYIFEPDIIGLIPQGYAKFEVDVFPKLAKEGRLFGYHFSGYWSPLRNEKERKEAEEHT